MVLLCHRPSGWGSGRPRTRGDGPPVEPVAGGREVSAPHPRGWSARVDHAFTFPSVGPAPAGMVRSLIRDPAGDPRRPRTRGDGPASSGRIGRSAMSAPHPRGWSLLIELFNMRVIGRPRTRGDGPVRTLLVIWVRKSAPHPRGWSAESIDALLPQGVGPAPAGMVQHRNGPPSEITGRPRTRGDGPAPQRPTKRNHRSAPHPRGWSGRNRACRPS